MGVIHVLDSAVADQIAAGEVVERPASVVKELIENALDAGARNIEISVDGGGLERIRVIDDGGGMDADDAVLCFSRHATSKLTVADELRRLGTYGFRGEALAAIASVSKLCLVTRPAARAAGYQVRVEAGRVVHIGDSGGAFGTRIDVDDLFFNTPARRKFLKATRTEAGHVEDAIADAALVLPSVGFRLMIDGKLALDLPGAPQDAALAHAARIDRAVRCLGKHVRPLLFPLEASTELLAVRGYVVAPLETRRDLYGVHLSVNRRPITDRGLVQAVRTAFRTLLEVGRQPIVALDITIDAELVDVNVHPRKAEVRFAEPRRVSGHLIAMLSDFLATTPWLKSSTSPLRPRVMVLGESAPFGTAFSAGPRVPLGESAGRANADAWSAAADVAHARGDGERAALASADASSTRDAAADVARARGDVARARGDGERAALASPAHETSAMRGATERMAPAGPLALLYGSRMRDALVRRMAAPLSLLPEAGTGGASSFSALRVVGQLGGIYLILEGPQGMVVIDQHAAHERVVFERLRSARAQTAAPSQPMLIPLQVELTLTEMSALEDESSRAVLERHGLVIEPFGARAGLIKALPPGLEGRRAEQIARDALAELAAGTSALASPAAASSAALEDRMDRVCARLACHAAIRAGDAMHGDSVRALLVSLDAIDFGAHCPHGRPVVRTLRLEEMATWFHRR